MPDPYQSLEAVFAPLEYSGAGLPALSRMYPALTRLERKPILVPAGATKLLILNENTLPSLDPVCLYVESDVEDVEWWPVVSATPSIDPGTMKFGNLLDPFLPDFQHSHGGIVSTDYEKVHTGNTTDPYYSVLPCSLSYAVDLATLGLATGPVPQGAAYGGCFTKVLTGPIHNVSYKGKLWDLKDYRTAGDPGGTARILKWLYGTGAYLNLGTDGDGLGLIVRVYTKDKTKVSQMNLYFASYPFTSQFPTVSSLPALGPLGYAPFSKNDSNLCRSCIDTAAGGNNLVGWANDGVLSPNAVDGATWRCDFASTLYKDGWFTMGKGKPTGGLTVMNPATSTRAPAGDFVWNRVTEIAFAAFTSAASENYLMNVWFGPVGGGVGGTSTTRHILRPYDFFTGAPWTFGTVPAIGLQNPTDRAAHVFALFGTTAT